VIRQKSAIESTGLAREDNQEKGKQAMRTTDGNSFMGFDQGAGGENFAEREERRARISS